MLSPLVLQFTLTHVPVAKKIRLSSKQFFFSFKYIYKNVVVSREGWWEVLIRSHNKLFLWIVNIIIIFYVQWIYFILLIIINYYYVTYRWHERVQDADSEGRTARKRLGEIQLRVGVIIVVLVEKLHVAIVNQFGNHGNVGAVHRPSSLQHYWPAGAVQTVRIELFGHRGLVCKACQNQIKCECIVLDNTRMIL